MTWTTAIKKALLYRLFGACMTGLIVLIVGGTLQVAGILVLLDTILRTFMYIIFEKIWNSE